MSDNNLILNGAAAALMPSTQNPSHHNEASMQNIIMGDEASNGDPKDPSKLSHIVIPQQ